MKWFNNFNICQPQLFTSLQTVATETVINIQQKLHLTKKISNRRTIHDDSFCNVVGIVAYNKQW